MTFLPAIQNQYPMQRHRSRLKQITLSLVDEAQANPVYFCIRCAAEKGIAKRCRSGSTCKFTKNAMTTKCCWICYKKFLRNSKVNSRLYQVMPRSSTL